MGRWAISFDDGDRVMYLHARHFNDPRSNWLAQHWSQPATYWTVPLFDKLFYRDYTAATVTQPTNSLDRWIKQGYQFLVHHGMIMQHWLPLLIRPPRGSSHEHRDNNSFTIYKKTLPFIDAGYYDTYGESHYLNYYERNYCTQQHLCF